MPVSVAMKNYLAGSILLVTTIEITEILPDGSDGDVIRVTDYSRRLTISGNLYTPISLDASQIQQLANLEPDNLEIVSLLTGDFTSQSLRNRKWYGARVIYAKYNPLDLTMGPLHRKVTDIGQVHIARHTGKVELRTLSQRLDQPVGQVTTAYSPTELGDLRCKIDLNGTTVDGYEITMTAEVSAVTDRQVFEVVLDGDVKPGESTAPDDFYAQGNAIWTSGDNEVAVCKILKNHANEISLWLPTFYDIQVGDEVTLIAGCLRTREACRDKFDNMVNFRGFPDLPGPDRVFKIPDAPTA